MSSYCTEHIAFVLLEQKLIQSFPFNLSNMWITFKDRSLAEKTRVVPTRYPARRIYGLFGIRYPAGYPVSFAGYLVAVYTKSKIL